MQSPFNNPSTAATAHAACQLFACVLLQQYVPLFLTKEDLDVAVGGAYRQRNAAQIKAVKEKAAQYEEEYQQVMREVGGGLADYQCTQRGLLKPTSSSAADRSCAQHACQGYACA